MARILWLDDTGRILPERRASIMRALAAILRHPPKHMPIARIESLDQEGRGVAHPPDADGKTIFINGALIGETVEYSSYRRKPSFEMADAISIASPNSSRVTPRCPHFGVCGGCALQHLDAAAQVASKQRTLEDALWHIGRVHPDRLLPAIYGPAWNYRNRARLSVRDVFKKGEVLVGFHEKRSSFVADIRSCDVLPKRISDLLVPLRRLIESLSIRKRVPQIELACVDPVRVGETPIDVLVLRLLEPLSRADFELLKQFSDHHGVRFYGQTAGPETAKPLYPEEDVLAYELPEFDVRMPFRPTEFTQVNLAVNRVMVRRAVALLDPRPGERIVDLFCGLGNFTLPIARRGAYTIGVEGSASLVARARANAVANGLGDATEFHQANLFEATPEHFAAWGRIDKAMIDPPREGAIEIVRSMPVAQVSRIVYVSCNASTLARDAGVLVNVHGYRFSAAGVVNMFPHTTHVESIALFERDDEVRSTDVEPSQRD